MTRSGRCRFEPAALKVCFSHLEASATFADAPFYFSVSDIEQASAADLWTLGSSLCTSGRGWWEGGVKGRWGLGDG